MINVMPWLRKLGTEYYFLFLALILIAIIICVKYVDVGLLKVDKLLWK